MFKQYISCIKISLKREHFVKMEMAVILFCLLTILIWTLPTSSEQSFAFAPVVSAVAFVYPACCGR
ncbi:hypothetical protein ACPA2M_26870, partial [Ectopseudomonas chengduensis]